jgi:hypothetical protein
MPGASAPTLTSPSPRLASELHSGQSRRYHATMGVTATLTGSDRNFRVIQRRLADALHQAPHDTDGAPTLEAQRITTGEPPRFARAAVIEGGTIGRRLVPGSPVVGFAAFLDGIQASRPLLYDASVPIVHGSVGGAIRIRGDRRLSTWEFAGESRVYAPLDFISAAAKEFLQHEELDVIDTTPRRDGEPDDDARHPLTLADVAVHAVQAHRESLEQRLSESWVARGSGVLYIDGGISGSARVASAASAVGVVKSHRVLYGDPLAVRTILSLEEGERSSVFTVDSPDKRRSAVASWYLRLRDAAARDPLWGMVRVEIAPLSRPSAQSITDRADEISRWILAEVAPLSLPDSRWHTMVYGIRDCEQFLRSISPT